MNLPKGFFPLTLIIAALIYYLLLDMGTAKAFWRNDASEIQGGIGRLIQTRNSVQVREKESLFWLDGKDDKPLQFYDSILTLADSRTRIELKDGTLIDVEPDTLIVLEPAGKESAGEFNLVLVRGNAQIVSGSNPPKIVQRFKPTQYAGINNSVDKFKENPPLEIFVEEEITLPEEVVASEPPKLVKPHNKKVVRKPAKVQQSEKAIAEEPKRETKIVVRVPVIKEDLSLLEKLRRSTLELQGISMAMVSGVQAQNGQDIPEFMATGLRGKYWPKNFEHMGFEFGFLTKAMNYNAQAQNTNPMSFDFRGHYNWLFKGFPMLRFIQASRVSLFVGANQYQNTQNQKYFIERATIPEAGVSTDFIFSKRWQTGGELSYGTTGNLMSIRFMGGLQYEAIPQWLFGIGYRINYFEARSSSVSPDQSLPYREAQGLLFGTLKYIFY